MTPRTRWIALLTSITTAVSLLPATATATVAAPSRPGRAGSTGPSTVSGDGSSATAPTTVTRDGASVTVRRSGPVAPRRSGATRTSGAVTSPTPGTTAQRSSMDLDGDGRDEIVAGGFLHGGYGVQVTYSKLWWRDHITAPIPSPTRPNFGDEMTSGDFNGDGFADLVVANPGEFAPDGAFGGGVWIFYGSRKGLYLDGPQHFNQDVDGVPGEMESYDMFGGGLAAGDLNGDGYADLAIGAYGDKVNGIAGAGSVTVLFGGATGLTATGVQQFTQDTPGVPSTAETSDTFGRALAIGDMTGDGYADLAISAPEEGEGGGPVEGGLVMLLPGGPDGVTATGVTSFLGTSLGVGALGDYLSIADIDGDGDGDLVAGAPRSWVGYIVYVPGIPAGLDVAQARVISMETPGVPGDPHRHVEGDSPHAYFGNALSTGDVTGDGRADVLTGAMRYDVSGVLDAGAVLLIPGTAQGLTGAGSVMLTQQPATPVGARRVRPGLDKPDANDYFGEATTILNLDGVGPLDMIASTSRESDSGLVAVLGLRYAPARRPTPGRPASAPVLTGLTPVDWWTGAEVGAYSLGHTLLHR